MIFRSVKIVLFAFFTLALGAGNAACACCLPIDAGHPENSHQHNASNASGHMAHQKTGAAMSGPGMSSAAISDDHGGHGDDNSQQSGPCVDDCNDCAPAAIVEATSTGDRFVERSPQPAEKRFVENSGIARSPDWFSSKPFALRHWRAPPRQTPFDEKIRLLI